MATLDVDAIDHHGQPVHVGLVDRGNGEVGIVIDPPGHGLSSDAPGPDRVAANLPGDAVMAMVLWLAHRGLIDIAELAEIHDEDVREADPWDR